MKILNKTKETEEIKPTYGCEFCNRKFLRESTVVKHICEYKHRFLEKDKRVNQIAFQAWLQFYKKNSATKKNRTYEEFIKSPYYTAFVKFSNHCLGINALNIPRYVDWLLKNQIKIDTWNTDSVYNRFLIDYLRDEDPLDAVKRSIETTMDLAETILHKDVLRYGNKNKICYAITTGKISPWLLFLSESGVKFVESLDETQVKLVIDYIDPEKWAIKFKRNTDATKQVKELLAEAGY